MIARREALVGLLGLLAGGCGGKGVDPKVLGAAGAVAQDVAQGAAGLVTQSKPTLCVDVVQVRAIWATVKTIYSYLRPQIVQACAAPTRGTKLPAPLSNGAQIALTPGACLDVKRFDLQLRQLAFEVDRTLDNPGVEPNWSNIVKAIEILGKLVSLIT